MHLFCVLTVASFHGTSLSKACLSSTEIYVKIRRNGGMAERTKAPVLKTGMGKPIVGSNPTPSDFCLRVLTRGNKNQDARMGIRSIKNERDENEISLMKGESRIN